MRLATALALAFALPAAALDLEGARLVDLTHPFDARTIYWPTARRFTLEPVHHGETPGGWWYAANDFCAAEHGGTHLDAPIHFAAGGWTADAIPLDRLVGPAVVVDVVEKADRDRDALLEPADLEAFEARAGRIPDGAVVLVRTGWDRRWGDAARYLGSAERGAGADLHFPGVSESPASPRRRRGGSPPSGASARSASTRRRSTTGRRRISAPTGCSRARTSRCSRTSRGSASCRRGAPSSSGCR